MKRLLLGVAIASMAFMLASCGQQGPTTLTVNGTVVGVFDEGVAGASVLIQGQTATTDANGHFTIAGVRAPYDVAVKETFTGSSKIVAHVFTGMSTATPTLLPYSALIAGGNPTATVEGNLASPVPAGDQAIVCLEGLGQPVSGCTVVASGSTGYTIYALWQQGSSASVRLHALLVSVDGHGVTTGLVQYGTVDGTVTNGGTITSGFDVTLGSVPWSTTNVTLDVNPPPGFGSSNLRVGVPLNPRFTLLFVYNANGYPTSVTVPAPIVSGADYAVMAQAEPSSGGGTSAAWQSSLVAAGTATLDLTAPPTPSAPADGAINVGVGSRLSVVSSGSGALTFTMDDSATKYLAITTMGTSVTIPDLSAIGFSLGSGVSYEWGAVANPAVTSANDMGTAWLHDYLHAVLALQAAGPDSGFSASRITSTGSRTFTTP